MDPTELLAAMTQLVEGLKADMTALCDSVDKKHTELSNKFDKLAADSAGSRSRRSDNDGPDAPSGDMNDAANRVAADAYEAIQNNGAIIRGVSQAVQQMQAERTPANLDALADAQAKADGAYSALGQRATGPMFGETLINYNIRLHRGLQEHSPKWKSVDLRLLAQDHKALNNVCDEIRSDAVASSMNFDKAPEFVHREITQTSPTGHKMTSFVGRGTMFKQLTRPVRHIAYIGTRDSIRH